MPLLTRLLIRVALGWLVVGLVVGLLGGIWPDTSWVAGSWPVALHLLTLGWLTQLVAGVAFWMFPRVGRAVPTTDWRGWGVFGLLNLGLVLRVVAEPTRLPGPWLPLAALMQLGAMVLLAWSLWPRLRGR